MLFTKSIIVLVAVSNMGVFCQTWNESELTVLLGYVTLSTDVSCYQTHRM